MYFRKFNPDYFEHFLLLFSLIIEIIKKIYLFKILKNNFFLKHFQKNKRYLGNKQILFSILPLTRKIHKYYFLLIVF